MPKTFYTDRDIEDLVKQGIQSLIVDDDVVLTDLAYDKAHRLGLELLTQRDQPPAGTVNTGALPETSLACSEYK